MNFGELKQELNSLISFEGWTDAKSPLDRGAAINSALAEWSWEAEYWRDETSFTTTADTSAYTLTRPPDWKYLSSVIYNDVADLTLTDESALVTVSPLWSIASSGTPDKFLFQSPNTIRLYPTPSASGITVRVRGVRGAATLTADSDIPACPLHYHRHIARLAAYYWGERFAVGDARGRIDMYRKESLSAALDCKADRGNQLSPVLQRRMTLNSRERIIL